MSRTMSESCLIHTCLRNGDPRGLRHAEIEASSTYAIAFNRNQLKLARDHYSEHIEQPGVYMLIGRDESASALRKLYIGQSENVRKRLGSYVSQGEGKNAKGYWSDTIILTRMTKGLTRFTTSHAQFVESCLIRFPFNKTYWRMQNSLTPAPDAGNLPIDSRPSMNKFVDEAKILVGALGWDIFRGEDGEIDLGTGGTVNDERPGLVQDEVFYYSGEDFRARMRIGTAGDFVVQKDSIARADHVHDCPKIIRKLRAQLIEEGTLVERGRHFIFEKNQAFEYIMHAALVVSGYTPKTVAAKHKWKLEDGTTYKKWEADQGA